MPENFDKLSDITGLSPEVVRKIAEEVKLNSEALRLCPRHDFAATESEALFRQKYKCRHCFGTINYHAYHWYELGKRAGRQ